MVEDLFFNAAESKLEQTASRVKLTWTHLLLMAEQRMFGLIQACINDPDVCVLLH